MQILIFTFKISPEGMLFVKETEKYHHSNVEYSENQSTVGLKSELSKKSNLLKEFKSTIISHGLIIGQNDDGLIYLDSSQIIEYPYELKEL